MKTSFFTFLVIGIVTFCFGYWTSSSSQSVTLNETDYICNVVDDSIVVYHNDKMYVGTVKLQGQLDSLIMDDNF